MISNSSSRQIKSVQTAFQLVATIQNHGGATLNELSEQSGLAKSTVHNYLGTLASMGYVRKSDRVYRLGLKFLTHGMAARNSLGIRDVVRHFLADVADETGQPTWWVVEEIGRGIFVEKLPETDSAEIYGRVGKRSYLHTHAPGKAILAKLSDDYVHEIVEHEGLPVHTNRTITDSEELFADLKRIRERGYAVSDGEAALGVQSIGVAFEGPHGFVHGLGVFGYSHDIGGSNLESTVPRLLEDAVDEIGQSLAEGE